MTENQARVIADALGGEKWHSGGGIWLVRFPKADGWVVLSDGLICEYADQSAFDDGRTTAVIEFGSAILA